MMICYKDIPTVCQTRRAKTKTLKYWCHVCRRYVLQDEYHRWKSPRLIEPGEVRFMDEDLGFARAIGLETGKEQIMVEKHWHCMECMALLAVDCVPVKTNGLILCGRCDVTEETPELDWAKLPEMMLEKQEFAKKMGVEFDEDGVVHLRKHTPTEQMVYYQTKYVLWQVEKRLLERKLLVATHTLKCIASWGEDVKYSDKWAKIALSDIDAIGKESDDGKDHS